MKKASKVLALLLSIMTVFAMASGSVLAASGADLVAAEPDPAPDSMSDVPLIDLDLSEYGISMTVPQMDVCVSAKSGGTEGIDTLGVNASGLVETNFLLYDITSDGQYVINVQYSVTPYTKAVGSYNKLNAQELADELEAFDTNHRQDTRFGEYEDPAVSEKMGGSTVLHARFKDTTVTSGDTVTDVITTIQNGVCYTIISRLGDMNSDEGKERHDKVIDSIRFSAPSLGYGYEGNIARNSYGINIFLLIATIILLILAALLFFFFYRFSAFQKAADSSFNIFGFDMPYHSDHDDNYVDEDGDGFDDAHDNN